MAETKRLGPPPSGTGPAAWNELYARDDAGWDLRTISPPLVAFAQAKELPSGRRVLVPGCGTGHEVVYLAQQGYHVLGCDFAPLAIDLLKERLAEAGLPEKHASTADALGDQLPVAGFDWIFEQTFFCALQPEQRPAYAKQMYRVLEHGGELWALNLRTSYTTRQPYDCAPQDFVEMMTEVGFECIEKRPLHELSHSRRRGRETLIRLQKPA